MKKILLTSLIATMATFASNAAVSPYVSAHLGYTHATMLSSDERNDFSVGQWIDSKFAFDVSGAFGVKYDLSKSDISLYITAEPCMMCVGAIMWSGIKNVYYGVPSKTVEKLTGFDEGFKPRWFNEFKKRGINVYGNICTDEGADVLKQYKTDKKKIYMPKR